MLQIVSGQLTEEQLKNIVANNQCDVIAHELESTNLFNEEMKFNAAICIYRNGNADRALQLFKEVQDIKGMRWKAAIFWEGKIYAAHNQDSLALHTLQSMPGGFLNYKLLSHPEFETVSANSKAFAEFKNKFRPGFNFWTGLLFIISVIGIIVGFVLLFFLLSATCKINVVKH